MAELDRASETAFAAALGPLFEEAPAFLGRLAARRPFGTWDRLFAVAEEVALSMPEADRIELLDAHPRIGADPSSVSALSFVEQGYDRERADALALAQATELAGVAARLGELNDAYEARFGFRFVVFVAGRPRAAIVPLIDAALGADRDDELIRGTRDVVAIARARAARLGATDEGEAG
jgi:2-oxo-4-hydroxy-4-carboxy--5-ureidoimidazoline (OHCU) decarboxylase